MQARPCLFVACAPSGSRIHPPYVKPFRKHCPAESTRIVERPKNQGPEQLQNLAVEEVNKAEATRSIEKRLQTPAELQRLFREENLDREALFLTLRDRLQVSGAPQEITGALLLVESPTLGEKAYAWLSGKRIEDPATLGIPYQLDALPIGGETTSVRSEE